MVSDFWGAPRNKSREETQSPESGPLNLDCSGQVDKFGMSRQGPRKFETTFFEPTFESVSQMWSQVFSTPGARSWIPIQRLLLHPPKKTGLIGSQARFHVSENQDFCFFSVSISGFCKTGFLVSEIKGLCLGGLDFFVRILGFWDCMLGARRT